MSYDGSVVVGNGDPAPGEGVREAFRWTSDGGMQWLGQLPGGSWSYANDVSYDGSVVVGISHTGPGGETEAFRWTSDGGIQGLGQLPGGSTGAATGVSGDSGIARVSIVGAGMKSNPGVAATMFEVLAGAGINIEMIQTYAIRLTCVVREDQAEQAVGVLHAAFGLAG